MGHSIAQRRNLHNYTDETALGTLGQFTRIQLCPFGWYNLRKALGIREKQSVFFYSGYEMRSHSETRWAAMMDAVGVVWLYEPRREDTRHGWYKPDFYVPAAGVFVEVKGPAPTKVEVEKAADVEAATGCPVIFAYGRPELVRGQVKGAELAYFFKGKRAVISLEEIRELVFQSMDLRTHSEFLAALASQQQYHLRDISNILLGWLTVLLDRSQQEDIFEKNNKPLNDLKASRHLQHSTAEQNGCLDVLQSEFCVWLGQSMALCEHTKPMWILRLVRLRRLYPLQRLLVLKALHSATPDHQYNSGTLELIHQTIFRRRLRSSFLSPQRLQLS
ncbi:hypothetical protein [Azotobacter chroococcum]|uniref:hypothetical protein n=1 Tax=Azotobacter chroococcum TaxID=353 RepID=UPI000AB533AF|nr:hypothetical protein [Azotobacter chroococcum]